MDKKIRVLYLINYAGCGGSEKYLKMLESNMSNDVLPILCYNEEGLLVTEFEEKNIETIRLEMKSPFDILAALNLKKICKEKNIDIIHSNYLRENYIAILSKFFGNKAKIVYTCHFNLYDSKLVSLMNKVFYKGLSKIIAISKIVKDSLIKSGSPKNKIRLIYHGVEIKEDEINLESVDDIKNYKAEYKEKYGIDKNTLVIGSASRFSKEKGNEFLIRSVKLLKEKIGKENNIKFKILLANGGTTKQECQKLCNTLKLDDVISFVGYIKEDMDVFYKACDIYVTSSSNEGLGLATLESLSHGVCNVVTNIGGLKEIVNDETNCGLSCNFDDDKNMAEHLYTLLKDDELRLKLSINAQKVIKEKFSIQAMMKDTLDVYKEVLNIN